MAHRKLVVCVLLFLFGGGLVFGQAGYSPDKEGFIHDWLVAGPFPSEPGDVAPTGLYRDFLGDHGGESNVLPFAGMAIKGVVFPADKGTLMAKVGATNCWGYTESKTIDVTFKEVHGKPDSPGVPLDDLHADFRDYYVSYLAAYVFSPIDQSVRAGIGSDDDFRLWIHGELAGEFKGNRAPTVDENICPATLKKGWNAVLLKINDRMGQSSAIVRFLSTDKAKKEPIPGLKVALELPQHRLLRTCKNIERIDALDGECFARIDLGEGPCLAGETTLTIKVGRQTPASARMTMAIKGPEGVAAWTAEQAVKLKPDSAVTITKPYTAPKGGAYEVTLTVPETGGKSPAVLKKTFTIIGPEQLNNERGKLLEKTNPQKQLLKNRTDELATRQKDLAATKTRVNRQYEQMEKQFAERRAKVIASYGDGAKSISRPFVPAATGRTSLCLNGDLWEIAPAKSTSRSSIDETFIPTSGWEPATVPTIGIEYYFRGAQWPVKGGDTQYAPASQALDRDRACGFTINEGRENNAMYLRTEFTVPDDWKNRRILLATELAHYKTKIWVNDQFVGEHDNWCNPLEMDLTKYVKPGKNKLMAFVGRAWLYKNAVSVGNIDNFWGLMGDVVLKTVPDVRVADVWVITDWRNARLIAKTRVTNASGQSRTVTLHQQAVLDGAVRCDAGQKTLTLTPNGSVEVQTVQPWADPKCWDIGSPVLYHLASTLSENNSVLDQHFQRFGFREFWKSKFDYWLNGKRLFIQGDIQENCNHHLSRPYYQIWYSMLRKTGNINTIRTHFDKQQSLVATICDELGMLYIPQTYTCLAGLPEKVGPDDVENYRKGEIFKRSCEQQANWVRWLRNHPSVVIWDVDNEVFTQAAGKPWDGAIRNDRCAALTEPFVKSLDPTRLVTRCGDQGTWGKMGAWQQDPPADIANYHYPEHLADECIRNWQYTYDKPVLFGECLYNAYGAWDNCVGATPAQVRYNANRLRTYLSLMKDEDISGWVAMGLSHDGWIERRPGGIAFDLIPTPKTPQERLTWYKQGKLFPGMRMIWPAQSGPGFKMEFGNGGSDIIGWYSINWYIPGYPPYVSSPADRAYKENTRPMPDVPDKRTPEVIYEILKDGKPLSGAFVILTPLSGQGTEPVGVRADQAGKAWFLLREPGEYRLTVLCTGHSENVKVELLPNDLKPGLNYMPQVTIVIKETRP